MKKFIVLAAIFVLLALLFVASPISAQITDWESYRDSDRTIVWGTVTNPYDATYNIVYMAGSGFPAPTYAYKVGYYDGAGLLAATDTDPGLIGTTLLSSYALDTDPTDTEGTWHAVVHDTTGTMPAAYSDALTDPDYVSGADDDFEVLAEAIPEFPTVIAMIVAVGLSFGIYYWMRKRYHRQVAVA